MLVSLHLQGRVCEGSFLEAEGKGAHNGGHHVLPGISRPYHESV